jgi:hypothetical protein
MLPTRATEHAISPDVKVVKAGLFVMHAVRYLGELTRCMACEIETCTKRCARQSGFGRDRTYTNEFRDRPHFGFTKSSPEIFVGARDAGAIKTTKREKP